MTDQHGTAIIVGAACLNGLQVVGKAIENVKLGGQRRGRGGRWAAWTCCST